jgi:ABC-2 type transport system permease protein
MKHPDPRRFKAIVKKEFRHIWRDPLSLGMLVFIPALLLVMYGYALSFDVKHIRIAVLDFNRTTESRAFLDSLFQNPYFDRIADLSASHEANDLLNRGIVRAVLVVPRDYSQRLLANETVRVQALVDASDANTATTTIGYLEALADRTNRKIRFEALRRARTSPSLPTVMLEPRIWFNPELQSAQFLVPGLIGMLLMIAAVVATSLSIVREKERGTMEQIMVSPVRPGELILGKILPYVLVCIVTMVFILLLGRILFNVTVHGSFLLLSLSTILFLFASLGMGVLISTVTRSQQLAFQIAILTSLLPAVVLSGLIFPIRNMPLPIQGLTWLVIPRHFMAVLRDIILRDAPLSAIAPKLASLLVLGLVFNLLAALRVRKTL